MVMTWRGDTNYLSLIYYNHLLFTNNARYILVFSILINLTSSCFKLNYIGGACVFFVVLFVFLIEMVVFVTFLCCLSFALI